MFALSVNVGVESDGQVLAGQLSSHVQSLFQSAINNLDLIGQLVTGQATDGDCRCFLPCSVHPDVAMCT